jgi:ABC-2 type transport system permease protein
MTTRSLPGVEPAAVPAGGPADDRLVPSPALRAMFSVVVQRELVTKLKDKTFIFSTIFLLVLVGVSIAVPALLRDDNPKVTVGTVGADAAAVVADATRLGERLSQEGQEGGVRTGTPVDAAALGVSPARVEARAFPDVAAVEAALRAGTVDGALVPASGVASGGDLQLVADTSVPEELSSLVAIISRDRALTGSLQGAGLDAAGAERALAEASASAPAQRLLDPSSTDRGLAIGLGAIFAAIFFLASLVFGMAIAQSVVEEKQSRVVEILVAAVPVRVLLAGKVAANTLLAFGQTALLVGMGIAAAGLAGQGDVVSVVLRTGGWFLLFFVLGFTMLATLWAASGALASRVEDLNATTVPMQTLVMLPFFAAVWVTDPGTFMRVLSYVPLTAPVSMPQRLILGDAAWWEALISAAIVLATAAAVVQVAARIYRHNLLRTAGRTPWRQALRG